MTSAFVFSIGVGAVWHALSLFCLARLLRAWLGSVPSTRSALGWLFVKGPVLYLALWGWLRQPSSSVIGFGLGFTAALLLALAWWAARTHALVSAPDVR